MSKIVEGWGFLMTEKQSEEIYEILQEDILRRYNNSEYWDYDIIQEYAHDNKLKEIE